MTCLRAERLRFVAQLSSKAADTAWALATRDTEYLAALHDALRWMYGMLKNTIQIPSPLEHWESWKQLLRERPRRWKGWLKRAVELTMRNTQIQAKLLTFEHATWEPCASADVPLFEQGQHGCLLCRVAFQTKQAWAAHAVRAHNFRLRQALVAKGTQCQACRAYEIHQAFADDAQMFCSLGGLGQSGNACQPH